VVLLGPVLGVLHGSALAVAGAGALVTFAVGCFTSTLQSLLGLVGTLLSVITLVIIGNPASGGGQIPPGMMPSAWGWLAHILPNPAGMAAVRGIEFFSGQGTGEAFVVLSCYVAVAIAIMLAMAVIPAVRTRGQGPGEAAEVTTDLAAETGSGAVL
jgi:ABC-type multidrug transport system permease subunit